MAGLPYNCRCFTVTGNVAPMLNPSGGSGGSGGIGDKNNPNPPLGVAPPSGAMNLCNTNVVVPAGTPFLVLATGAGGGGGANGNYGVSGSPSAPMARLEVTGGAGGSGQPLCAYFYAKDYAVTLSAQCGVGGGGPLGPNCAIGASGGNGGDGAPTIVTIGTQTAFLLPGKGGTGGSGGVNIACGYIPPVPLGGYGWKSGGEGAIITAPCSTPTDNGNCWTTNGVGTSPVPQLAVGGASIFGPGGAQSTGCSFYPNNEAALGAGGWGGGGAHFMNCGSDSGDGYPAGGGGNGAAFVILNPSNATLQAYGLLP